MTVKARFYVKSITHQHTGGGDEVADVAMAPVYGTYGDGKVNESWAKYTPSGQLDMTITNPDAVAQFELGKVYEMEFTPVD